MTAREFRPRLDEASPDTPPSELVVLCAGETLIPEPVSEKARAFLVWMLSSRDARRGHLAVDWPELAS